MKTVIVKVNNATQTIAEHTVVTQDGKPTVIKAVQKVNYELFDTATGKAPQHIVTKRVGKDLHVLVDEEGQESDLIIEGFYNDPDSALIGLAEDGAYYYYVPDSGEIAHFVTELSSGDVTGQALGGQAQSNPWWVGASESDGFNALPWLMGLAGLGIAGAALGGGSSSSKGSDKDTTAPNAPKVEDVTNIDEDGDGTPDKTVISGKTEPGAEVIVKDKDGNVIGKDKADEDGNYEVKVPALDKDEVVDVTAKDEAGNESDPTEVVGTGDDIAPNPPTVEDVTNIDEDGDGKPDDTIISGKTEPGAEVIVKDKDGNVIGKDKADEDGNYEVKVPALDKDEVVDVTAKDEAGNESDPTEVVGTGDDIAPNPPTVEDVTNIDEDGDGKPDDTIISGKTEPGAEVIVKDKDGNVIGKDKADEEGNYDVKVPALDKDEVVDVTAKDEAGNESDPTEVVGTGDDIAPNPPTVEDVTNIDEDGDGKPDDTIISGKTEPGAEVIVKDKDGNVIGKDKADEEGNYDVKVPALDKDEVVDVTAKDEAGNESDPTEVVGTGDDIAPNPPTVEDVTNIDEDGDGKPDDTIISGKTEPGAEVIVKDKDGNVIGKDTADEDGNYDVKVPALDKDEVVDVTAKDEAGNESDPTEVVGTGDDIAPNPPTVEDVTNIDEDGDGKPDDTIISGKTEPGAEVIVKDKDGNVIGKDTADEDGNYEVKVPALDKDEVVDVTAKDEAGNESDPTEAVGKGDNIPPNSKTTTIIIDDVTEDNTINATEAEGMVAITGKVTGEFKENNEVTLVINGESYKGLVDADGKFSIEVKGSDLVADSDSKIEGSIIATDAAGNTGTIRAEKEYVVDTDGSNPTGELNTIEFVDADDVLNSTESEAVELAGKIEAGGSVTSIVISDEDPNTADITVSADDISVDADGNVTVKDLDLSGLSDGTLTVTMEATDPAGNPADAADDTIAKDTDGPTGEGDNATKLVIDDVTDDNTINATEAEGMVNVTGSVTGEYKEGDEVTLVINGESYKGSVDASGNFSIEVEGSDLVADSDSKIEGSIVATDAAGNTGTITATKDYVVDTDGPTGVVTGVQIVMDANGEAPNEADGDGFINAEEKGEATKTDVKVLINGDIVAGDIVSLDSNNDGTYDKEITVSGADITNGYVTLTEVSLPDEGGTLTVKAAVTKDKAGNAVTSPVAVEDSATIDTTPPKANLTTVINADDKDADGKPADGGDGIISKDELDNTIDRKTDVTVTLDDAVEVGDIVTLTTNTGQILAPIEITQQIVDQPNKVIVFKDIDLPADGETLEVTATITDAAGNVGASAQDSALINPASAPETESFEIKLQEDGNATEGNLNRPEITMTAEQLNGKSPEEIELQIGSSPVDSFYRINDDRSVTFFPREALDNGKYTLSLVGGKEAVTSDVNVNVGYTFSEDDFVYKDLNNDEMTAIKITSLPVNGKLYYDGVEVTALSDLSEVKIDNIAKLVYVPAKDQSDNDVTGSFEEIGFRVVNGAAEKSESADHTITIKVDPVADGTFTTVEDTALSSEDITSGLPKDGALTGFNKVVQGDLDLDYQSMFSDNRSDRSVFYKYYRDGDFGFHQPLNNNFLKGAIETTLVESKAPKTSGTIGVYDSGLVKSAQLFGANKGLYGQKNKPDVALVVKFEGLIYLEAGTSYKFNYDQVEGIDDALVINLGGKTVYEQHYFDSPEKFEPRNPLKVTEFVPEESGFYSLDMYHLNSGSQGRLGIQLNGKDLTTDNFLVYPDEAKLKEALSQSESLKDFKLSSLQGSIDGKNGYYTIEGNNIGEAGTWFNISDLSNIEVMPISSDDNDNVFKESGVVKLKVAGLPEGYMIRDITDPEHIHTFSSKEDVLDITDWNRAKLEVFAPLTAEAGREGIALITSSQDGKGDITQSYTHLHINVSKDSANYSGTTDDNTIILGTPDKPGTGDNVLFGGSGNDKLDGGAGNDVLFGDSAGGVRGGGFEYWDFSNFDGSIDRGGAKDYAWLVADGEGKTDQLTIGAWNVGGRSEDYKSTSRDYNNLEFANPNKGNTARGENKYTADDAGSWVLDMEARGKNELDIWQNVTTMPGEEYHIEVIVSNDGDTTMHVQWGGHTIGILEKGSTTMAALNKVQVDRETSGLPDGYSKYILTVAGDRESEFTELRILGHSSDEGRGRENGRILASVDLKPVKVGGDDTLIGGEGNDILYGQGGNDILWGGIEGGTGDDSTDTFVYSFNKDNGKDIIKDFEVGIDRIYLTDVLDAYRGLSMANGTTTDRVYNENHEYLKHITRSPGKENEGNSTVKSDDNLTIKDFRYDNNNGDDFAELVQVGQEPDFPWRPKYERPDPDAQGQYNQYITVEGDDNDDVVINFGSGSNKATGKDAYGSVTLEGVKYGSAEDGNPNTYGSIEELFGHNGHEQILWATTDGFHVPEGKDYNNLTNMDMTVTDLKIDGYYII